MISRTDKSGIVTEIEMDDFLREFKSQEPERDDIEHATRGLYDGFTIELVNASFKMINPPKQMG